MGKKLGAVFIIYGILNLLASIVLLFWIPYIGLAGIVWSIIIMVIGKWMRSNAKKNEERDALLKDMSKKLDEKK